MVLRETRRGDIFKDEPAIATLDTVESLYPRLPRPPNEVGSEIEMNMAETGGGLNPLTPEIKSQLVIQRIEQMLLDKQAMEVTVGTLQQEIEVEKIKQKQEYYVQTWKTMLDQRARILLQAQETQLDDTTR